MPDRDVLARFAADLGGCLRFFSRLPVPRLSRLDNPSALVRFETAAGAVPAAGALLAVPAAAVAAVLAGTQVPALAAGALVVATALLVTGAMHEDGLADTADGLGGGHTRERRLEIMRDSRIGTFGAAALALALLARAALVGALLASGPLAAAGAIVAAAAVSRAVMVAAWAVLPPARPDGMSSSAGRPGARASAIAVVGGAVLSLAALGVGDGPGVVIGIVAATAATVLLAIAAKRCIGGQTGDILGAVAALGEIAFLAGLTA